MCSLIAGALERDGYPGGETLRRASGLTDLFLSKPFALEKLTVAVEELLARRGAGPPGVS